MITHIKRIPHTHFVSAYQDIRVLQRYAQNSAPVDFHLLMLALFRSQINVQRLSASAVACAVASSMHLNPGFRADIFALKRSLDERDLKPAPLPMAEYDFIRYRAFLARSIALFVGLDLSQPICAHCRNLAEFVSSDLDLAPVVALYDAVESLYFSWPKIEIYCLSCLQSSYTYELLSGCRLAPEYIEEF